MKINWSNVLEQALGATISVVFIALVGYLYNVTTGNTQASSWLCIGLAALAVSIPVAAAWRTFRRFLSALGRWIIDNWRFVAAVVLLSCAVCGAYAVTQSLWSVAVVTGLVLANIFLTLWLISLYRQKDKVVFSDSFDTFCGWVQYDENGIISHTSDVSHTGRFCLKKDGEGDPSGGFRQIGRSISPGFLFSGWIYRPDRRTRGNGDRIAIESEQGNGYGFTVAHFQDQIWIEKRTGGNPSDLSPRLAFTPPRGQWYQFQFCVRTGGKLGLRIYDAWGSKLHSIGGISDDSYCSFDRVAVRGGFPYYVDDLRVELL
jgi:hypothetical protein